MDLNDKTVLITGSTGGVGRVVANKLAASGARLFIHGRNAEEGEHAVCEIKAAGGKAEFIAADLSSFAGVRALADSVRQRIDRLDVLINNAGIGSGGKGVPRQESADGHELRFAVNYLAGFLLTAELLPLLKKAAPSRIVNVASAGQQKIDFDDVMLERAYDGTRAYRQSKLAQILFTIELAGQLQGTGVIVNCLHPSTFMDTGMVRQMGVTPQDSVEGGADAIVNLAASPGLEGRSGLYFNRLKEAEPDEQARNEEARQKLWSLSETLTGAKFG